MVSVGLNVFVQDTAPSVLSLLHVLAQHWVPNNEIAKTTSARSGLHMAGSPKIYFAASLDGDGQTYDSERTNISFILKLSTFKLGTSSTFRKFLDERALLARAVASEGFRPIALTNGQNREQAQTRNSHYT